MMDNLLWSYWITINFEKLFTSQKNAYEILKLLIYLTIQRPECCGVNTHISPETRRNRILLYAGIPYFPATRFELSVLLQSKWSEIVLEFYDFWKIKLESKWFL